ncbi:hypothetical protein JCM1841_004530 [Sporobolomyces salmonicolor]
MEFANGFQEDDAPILSPRLSSSVASTAPRQPQAQRASPADTLDLTDDSPPPVARSLPSRPGPGYGPTAIKSADSLAAWLGEGTEAASPPSTNGGGGGGFGAYAQGSGTGFPMPQASGSGAQSSAMLGGASTGGASPSAPRVSSSGSAFAKYALSNPTSTSNSNTPTCHPASSVSPDRRYHPVPSSSSALFGRIPLISSASHARTPSAYLPSATALNLTATNSQSGVKNYYRQQSAAVKAAVNAAQSTTPASPPTSSPGLGGSTFLTHAQSLVRPSSASSNGKGKSREVVDLTSAADEASDDDIIVQDPEPVCIGQLTTFALIMHLADEILPPPEIPKTAPDGGAWEIDELNRLQDQRRLAEQAHLRPLPVHILRSEPVTDVQGKKKEMLRLFTPGKLVEFGFMDQTVGTVLGPLLGDGWSGTGVTKGGNGTLYCEAELLRSGEKTPCNLRLRLLLFALPAHVERIAQTLERATPPRYLEHPESYIPAHHFNFRYHNPHNPAAGVGSHSADAARRLQRLRSGLMGVGGTGVDAQRAVKAIDVQRKQVEQVFQNIKSGTDLEQVDPPPIVATRLYPHQKQALSFLLDREKLVEITDRDPRGGPPAMVSLWERRSDPYGKVVGWSNVVTDLTISGAKPPPQARGAILADDMGLGKTIVVISLVSTTLAAAREWASLPPTKDKHDPRFDESKKPPGVDIAAGEFKSQLYGIGTGIGGFGVDAPPGEKKESGKKKKAREKREKKAEDAIDARFGIIECRSRATLIVCPLSTVQNWESQFEEHTRAVEIDEAGGRTIQVGVKAEEESEEETEGSDGSGSDGKNKVKSRTKRKALSIYIYHGTSRLADPHKLADYDVVITTFSTLGSEYSRQVRAEEEREDAEEAAKELAAKRKDEVAEGITEVFGFGADGEVLIAPPGTVIGGKEEEEEEKKPKAKRKRKRIEGSGVSPLQAVQWFRVVLDEAHIIKEHRTIQARAACDLSTSRRICLTGTPLQNSLNDIFSLIRFLRLEPFTDRGVWNQHIGLLAKGERDEKGEVQVGDNLGTERLKVIMRHLTLRRTKDTKNEHGVPILALPPIDNKQIDLDFNPTEAAFYASRHTRYKHEFAQLQKTDSVGKNYCTILQELLKLRQICVHPALLQDSEDRSAAAGGQANLSDTIEKHGISKSRAIQLLALMADAGGGECAECGHVLASFSPGGNVDDFGAEEEEAAAGRVKKPLAKKRKTTKSATAVVSTSSLGNSEDDSTPSLAPPPPGSDSGVSSVVTKCQHVFCNSCFKTKMCSAWPRVDRDATALCTVCTAELIPALDAVEVGARELQKALERAVDEHPEEERKGKKAKKPSTRLFEHSTKTRTLMLDLLPFSQANPHSANYNSSLDAFEKTIGFQPVKNEIVKSVVFSQWTALLDRLGDALEAEHIAYRRLDGAMNRDQRGAAMEAFKTDPKCEVLLVSLRAGGVGLNLTAGRRVYLMEPFWNPAVENQAVDRIYRLGQTMPVQTIRFIMKKSIEANMLKIQQRKMNLAQMSVGRTLSKAELAKLRKEELGILLE